MDTIRLRDLLKYPKFCFFTLANLISRFGDSLDMIAYAWMVYKLTGSALLMGTLYAINMLPNFVFSIPAGLIADRLSKKRLIIMSHFGRGTIVALTSVLYMTGLLKPWHLFIMTFLNSTLETLSNPAGSSILPKLLDKDLIMPASGIVQSIRTLIELLGVSIAGALIALLGIGQVILIDSITFFIAFIMIAMIKIENDNKGKLAELNLKNALNDLREATAFVKQKPLVITIIMTAVFANLMFTPLNVLEPIFVTKYLGMGVMGMSIFSSIISISVILGGVAIGKFGQKIDRNKTIFLCVLIGGISYTCLGLPSLFGTVLPVVIFVLSCTFVLGVCVSILNTVISSYLMEITPENMLGRVFSLLSMLFLCANPIGGVVTCISEVIGLGNLIIIAGSLLFIFSIILKIILETQERLHPAMDMEA